VLHVAEVLAGEGLSHGNQVHALQGQRPRQAGGRGAAGQPEERQGQVRHKRRAYAIKDLDDFEGTRDAAEAIRNKVIDNLDLWLERFEQKAVERVRHGAVGQGWRRVCRLVTDIARRTACAR
jgi:L-lactate utilization protein LutB